MRLCLCALSLLALSACAAPAAFSRLHIDVPEAQHDADVYVDGEYIGNVAAVLDPSLGGVALAPGTHRVELRKPGHFSIYRTVEVANPPPPAAEIQASLLPAP